MTRSAPEARLQISVKQHLSVCLPPNVFWTASLTGVNLSIRAATKAKAMGVRRGFPDLCFVFPDGVTRWIELKAGASLSPEQRQFRDHTERHGVWALCRTVEEVDAQLRVWGVPMRNHPFGVRA